MTTQTRRLTVNELCAAINGIDGVKECGVDKKKHPTVRHCFYDMTTDRYYTTHKTGYVRHTVKELMYGGKYRTAYHTINPVYITTLESKPEIKLYHINLIKTERARLERLLKHLKRIHKTKDNE